MGNMQVIENLLPIGYADAIEYDLTKSKFPWYFIDDVTNVSYGNNSGFVHVAYDHGVQPSEWYPFIKPLVYSISAAHNYTIKTLYRIRVGLLFPTVEQGYTCNTPHVDFLWPHYTACYYVTDSDGDTILFNKTLDDVGAEITDVTVAEYAKNADFKVDSFCTPKKNTVCIFNGEQFHASTKPRYHDRRIVITVNYV
jgi:hypothetical protein